PYTGEPLKIAALVFRHARRAPELDRLTRKWLYADQVAFLARLRDISAVEIVGLDSHSQSQFLDFARVDRGQRARRANDRDDVCASCDAAEVYGGRKSAVDVAECRGREGRAGAVDCREGFEQEAGFQRLDRFLLQHGEVFGGCPKVGDG